jgi:hypothetical protein
MTTSPKAKVDPMSVQSVRVISTHGANGAPAGGYITFADGTFWGFDWNFFDKRYTFATYKTKNKRSGLVLPKRETALIAALNDGSVIDSKPIEVKLQYDA